MGSLRSKICILLLLLVVAAIVVGLVFFMGGFKNEEGNPAHGQVVNLDDGQAHGQVVNLDDGQAHGQVVNLDDGQAHGFDGKRSMRKNWHSNNTGGYQNYGQHPELAFSLDGRKFYNQTTDEADYLKEEFSDSLITLVTFLESTVAAESDSPTGSQSDKIRPFRAFINGFFPMDYDTLIDYMTKLKPRLSKILSLCIKIAFGKNKEPQLKLYTDDDFFKVMKDIPKHIRVVITHLVDIGMKDGKYELCRDIKTLFATETEKYKPNEQCGLGESYDFGQKLICEARQPFEFLLPIYFILLNYEFWFMQERHNSLKYTLDYMVNFFEYEKDKQNKYIDAYYVPSLKSIINDYLKKNKNIPNEYNANFFEDTLKMISVMRNNIKDVVDPDAMKLYGVFKPYYFLDAGIFAGIGSKFHALGLDFTKDDLQTGEENKIKQLLEMEYGRVGITGKGDYIKKVKNDLKQIIPRLEVLAGISDLLGNMRDYQVRSSLKYALDYMAKFIHNEKGEQNKYIDAYYVPSLKYINNDYLKKNKNIPNEYNANFFEESLKMISVIHEDIKAVVGPDAMTVHGVFNPYYFPDAELFAAISTTLEGLGLDFTSDELKDGEANKIKEMLKMQYKIDYVPDKDTDLKKIKNDIKKIIPRLKVLARVSDLFKYGTNYKLPSSLK